MLYLKLSYTWSNEYETFNVVQVYNNESTIKILPQLKYRNCIYELFELIIEKHKFKTTTKTLY